MVTINDIAEIAGVSKTTVSRVINDKPDVSKKTKKKILNIMNEHDYHPSALATGTSTKKTQTLGVVLPNKNTFNNPFFVEILSGINKAAIQNGYYTLLCNTSYSEKEIVSIYKQNRVDAYILVTPSKESVLVKELMENNISFISTSKLDHIEDINYVDIDNVLGAELATKHLISLGHKKIGLINGPSSVTSSIYRKESFCNTLLENDLKINDNYIAEGVYSYESGFSCMKEIISEPNPPTAVFISCDVMAFGAIQYLKRKDIKIPDEISIVGFDDLSFSNLMT